MIASNRRNRARTRGYPIRIQFWLWVSAAGIGNRQPPERVKQHVNRAAWTLAHTRQGRGGEADRRGFSGIVGHSWTLGAALRSICSWKLTPKKLCSCDGTGPEWTVCGLCVDWQLVRCGF